MTRDHLGLLLLLLAIVGFPGGSSIAQEEAVGAPEERFTRRVQLPAGAAPTVIVCDFFTQGALAPGGANLSVVDGARNPVPFRLLQQGPGDLARLAFAPVARQSRYTIAYGGPAGEQTPLKGEWSPSAGLLFEARKFTNCNLNDAGAVAAAFATAEPIGADLVPNVYHRANPVAPDPLPFFSRYSGTLRIEQPGRYTFYTSSQDCSFMYIDDQLVVSSPGAHGPVGQARFKGEINLTAGPHKFMYLHAARGGDTCMVAAWLDPHTGKIGAIPSEAFGSGGVARLAAAGPYRDGDRRVQDFVVASVGEVPLHDDAPPLVRVQFRSPTAGARGRWELGDGQTATGSEITHIYLHPGPYTVTLQVPGDPPGSKAVNRVWIHRPIVPDDPKLTPDTLSSYLPILGRFEASKLDPLGIQQLVRASLLAGQPARATEAGSQWLATDPPPVDGAAAVAVSDEIAPLLRDPMGQPEAALVVWQNAGKVAESGPSRARCAIEASELLIHDLNRAAEAVPLLEAATNDLGSDGSPDLRRRLQALLGDAQVREGDGAGARASYERAAAVLDADQTVVQREARRGAHGRSIEAFLRVNLVDRAVEELRLWQTEAPEDRMTGDLALLEARIWAANGKQDRVLRVADDLLVLQPNSAYADQLLDLSARSELALKKPDDARLRWERLLRDYPGSPLVPSVKSELAKETPASK